MGLDIIKSDCKVIKRKLLIALLLLSIVMLVLTPLLFEFTDHKKLDKWFIRRKILPAHLKDQFEIDFFELWKPYFYILFFWVLGTISFLLLIGKNAYKIQNRIENKVFHAKNYVLNNFNEKKFHEKQRNIGIMFFYLFILFSTVEVFSFLFSNQLGLWLFTSMMSIIFVLFYLIPNTEI